MQSLTFSGLGWKGLVNTKGILIHLILECSHFLMGSVFDFYPTKEWNGHLSQFHAFKYTLFFLHYFGPGEVLEHPQNCPLSLLS